MPESDEAIYTVEHVGAVKHNCKGQFFVPLCFNHELGSTTINCQLDTGATHNVIVWKMCTQSYILMTHLCNQKPHS